MWWHRYSWLSLILCGFILAGCVQTTLTPAEGDLADLCSRIVQPEASKIVRDTPLNDADVLAWITATYGIAESEISRSQDSMLAEPKHVYTWGTNGGDQRYRIDATDGQVTKFSMGWVNGVPSIATAIECLGAPDSYIASVGLGSGDQGKALLLTLFYPQRGLSARSVTPWRYEGEDQHNGNVLPVEVLEGRFGGIRISQFDSVHTLIDEYLIDLGMNLDGIDRKRRDWYYSQVQPWPDSMEELRYTTDPYPEPYL